jgi:hypothetical protein
LLDAVNDQIATLKARPKYAAIVERWQGHSYNWHKTAADFL